MKLLISSNITIKDVICDGSSKSLENYKPSFNSTVVEKLKNDFEITNNFAINEFGVEEKEFINDLCINLENNVGISSDTFGNTSKSASKYNVIGYKPSYGLISRYGLFQVSSSFDTINVLSNNLDNIKRVTELIKGKDSFDMNVFDYEFTNNKKDVVVFETDKSILKDYIGNFKNLKVIGVDENIVNKINIVHKIISSVESLSAFGSFTSILIDKRGEGNSFSQIMHNYRTNNLGDGLKQNIILGSYILDQKNYNDIYIKALKNRRYIVNYFKDILKDNILLVPSYNNLLNKNFMKIANLGGFPYISVRDKFTIIGNFKDDDVLFNILKEIGVNDV